MLTTAQEAASDDYLQWNHAIGEVLFEGRFDRFQHLQLEPSVLEEVAQRAGHAGDDDVREKFVAAVRSTIARDGRGNPFLYHILERELWELDGRRGHPPCLALLSVLVLAAQEMVSDAQHASQNYDARLEQLLQLTEDQWQRVRRYFHSTVDLWQGLNEWLEDWEGERW